MFNYSSPKRHGDKATQNTRPRYALVTTWRARHNIKGNEHRTDSTHSYSKYNSSTRKRKYWVYLQIFVRTLSWRRACDLTFG